MISLIKMAPRPTPAVTPLAALFVTIDRETDTTIAFIYKIHYLLNAFFKEIEFLLKNPLIFHISERRYTKSVLQFSLTNVKERHAYLSKPSKCTGSSGWSPSLDHWPLWRIELQNLSVRLSSTFSLIEFMLHISARSKSLRKGVEEMSSMHYLSPQNRQD